MISISLIITTYNRPDALKAVLVSALNQTLPPFDIVIADDGSREETRVMVESMARISRIPIHHAWQEDRGFRAAAVRNLGVRQAGGEYLVFIDGDILLHPGFLEDHAHAARRNRFIKGSRLMLKPDLTARLIQSPGQLPGFWTSGVESRLKMLRFKVLRNLLSTSKGGWDNVRTCNLSLYREDFERVNGFDEGFEGWGLEDTEFVARLIFSGMNRLNLRFAGIGWHLYHREEPRDALPQNQARLDRTLSSGLKQCQKGFVELA